jgi:hypothetical protein
MVVLLLRGFVNYAVEMGSGFRVEESQGQADILPAWAK